MDDIHSKSIIHRDIKLANILFTRDAVVKIVDLGMATFFSDSHFCGTPNYLAPELLEKDEKLSTAVDIWAFGVIFYYMLVGNPPFVADSVPELYKNIKKLEYSFPLNLDLDPLAVDLIKKIFVKYDRPGIQEILNHELFIVHQDAVRKCPDTLVDYFLTNQ